MVFQDPLGSLNPAMRVASIVGEPLWIHKPQLSTEQRSKAAAEMLVEVGLDAALMDRFPHELSGGQAQRVAIARSLIANPSVLVCDEALAALDNTIKADILALLLREQKKAQLSLIFISHDLASVKQISDRVLVMYMGRVVEAAPTDELFARPQHPYTRALIDAVPVADPLAAPQRTAVSGEVSSLLEPPPGCVFNPRCSYAVEICKERVPDLGGVESAKVACHRAQELDLS
jgi:oligopeptide/dipeptide ABC transporter ATP-binding protein